MKYKFGFSSNPHFSEGYSDTDWISNNDKIKSTNEYVFIIGL